MVVEITLHIGWFTGMLLVVLVGFSNSLYIMYRAGTGVVELSAVVVDDTTEYEVEGSVYGYDTWWSSLLPAFAMMLGEFDLQVQFLSPSWSPVHRVRLCDVDNLPPCFTAHHRISKLLPTHM